MSHSPLKAVLRGAEAHLEALHAGRERAAAEAAQRAAEHESEREARAAAAPTIPGGVDRSAETDTGTV